MVLSIQDRVVGTDEDDDDDEPEHRNERREVVAVVHVALLHGQQRATDTGDEPGDGEGRQPGARRRDADRPRRHLTAPQRQRRLAERARSELGHREGEQQEESDDEDEEDERDRDEREQDDDDDDDDERARKTAKGAGVEVVSRHHH